MEGIVEFLDEQERNDRMKELLSEVAKSNIYTMGIAAEKDSRQALPDKPTIPDKETRVLRARLILEEALETIAELGCVVELAESYFDKPYGGGANSNRKMRGININDTNVYSPSETPIFFNEMVYNRILDGIIDGCCDTIYVCVGTLLACGVPDLPHLSVVCKANNSKFPKGVGITDENGKFQKPEGFKPPNHIEVIEATSPINLQDAFTSLKEIAQLQSKESNDVEGTTDK